MINLINNKIKEYINSLPDSLLKEIIAYSLLSNGKRIRPLLCLNLLKDLNIDYSMGSDVALAIELIHTYSLIHDDLPAMDNDTFRRNKLCAHIKYGQSNALLAGDSLLTDSFYIISNSKLYSDNVKLKLLNLFSYYSGIHGMILGQELDLNKIDEQKNIDYYFKMIDLKTGALIKLSLISALIIGGCSDEIINKWKDIGYKIGLAFQIQDDCLDDKSKDNYNILNFLSKNQALEMANNLYDQVNNDIKNFLNIQNIINNLFNREQ